MTGGSLGLRSGSYGSLQQIQHHHQQQLLQQQQILYGNGVSITSVNSALLPTNSPPVGAVVRKVSKMSVVGAKERRWPWICKFASRRKVGMLLLLIASVAVVLSFFFAITKDEDQPTGPETVIGNSDHVWRFVGPRKISSNYLSPPPIPVTDKANTPTLFDEKVSVVNNETEDKENTSNFPPPPPPLPVPPPPPPPPPFLPSVTIPAHHPCENYSLPPPPMDPKRTGPRPCDVCYVPVDLAMAYMPALPSETPILQNLNYLSEENLLANESNGGSIFGGHPSLQQRDESYDIKESMTVHCGFVKGKKPGLGTGFDIDEADMLEMEQCHGVVVASAIFGNYDVLQQPRQISEDSKRTACFYMFVDEETEAFIKNSTILDSSKRAGLWRLVIVRNLPYEDARRNGKVPKLLLHRLFPNARFSLWIDGKLELVVDPYQILERFLWRNNASFAISKHYRRFDVFVEAEANKAAGKYDNASIDNQIEFYKREGLTHFSPAKYPILSDVPEGCVIIREHTPITNLFTCLWFNEVDRFTSRDQLSFSTVRDKITSKVNWSINMFQDCERRNFVVQAYHRDVLEQRLASVHQNPSPDSTRETPRKITPDVIADVAMTRSNPSKKPPARRGNKKSGSKKRRFKGVDTARDPNPV